jgi:hypothetical protein
MRGTANWLNPRIRSLCIAAHPCVWRKSTQLLRDITPVIFEYSLVEQVKQAAEVPASHALDAGLFALQHPAPVRPSEPTKGPYPYRGGGGGACVDLGSRPGHVVPTSGPPIAGHNPLSQHGFQP